MSYLGDEIDRQLVKIAGSIDDLVPRSGLTRSLLYKWKRGEQTSIDDDQITLLAHALSDDPADHAALVRAHLLDEKFGPGSEHVEIQILGPGHLKDKPRPRSRGESALAYLAEERLKNADLNDLLLDLARVLGWVEEPGTAGKPAVKLKTSYGTGRPGHATRSTAKGIGHKAVEGLKADLGSSSPHPK